MAMPTVFADDPFGPDPIPAPIARPTGEWGWTADMVRSGEPIEISNGRRIDVLPTQKAGGDLQSWGAALLKSDPLVKRAGVEVGVSTHPGMLRAPDVSVLSEGGDNSWETVAPPLAIEYAGPGQDFADLRRKISELLEAGTRYLWVVRVDGPRRVEVYEAGRPMQIRITGQLLEAPGILANPIPVEALYAPDAAQGVILRNLLQRAGYRDLDEVIELSKAEGHAEGHAEGKAEGIAEGKAEGIAAGAAQAQRATAARLLRRRFPGAEPALLEAVADGDLEGLIDAILDAPSLQALFPTAP